MIVTFHLEIPEGVALTGAQIEYMKADIGSVIYDVAGGGSPRHNGFTYPDRRTIEVEVER